VSTATGPYVVAGPGTVQISPPGPVDQLAAVVIDNNTPYLGLVTCGTDQRWLQPFTSDLFLLAGNLADVPVALSAVAGESVAGAASYLTAAWLEPGESYPDAFPSSLTSQAVVAAITGQVSIAGTVPVSAAAALPISGNVGVPAGVSIPAGTAINGPVSSQRLGALLADHAVGWSPLSVVGVTVTPSQAALALTVVAEGAGAYGVTVTGTTTGTTYADVNSPAGTQTYVPIDTSIDENYTVNVGASAVHSGTLYVSERTDQVVVYIAGLGPNEPAVGVVPGEQLAGASVAATAAGTAVLLASGPALITGGYVSVAGAAAGAYRATVQDTGTGFVLGGTDSFAVGAAAVCPIHVGGGYELQGELTLTTAFAGAGQARAGVFYVAR
jgi:hypothetical protein